MKKPIIKGLVFGLIFFISVIIIQKIMNKGNLDMTAQMSQASLPIVYMQIEDTRYNPLYGYTEEMNVSHIHDSVTVLNKNRETGINIESYGEEILEVAYELRSIDGTRLIENDILTDLKKREEVWSGRLEFKDLIEKEKEYSLTLKIKEGNGDLVYYYTKVFWNPENHLMDEILFVKDFHNKTFDKEAAREITKYLESNDKGDNSTFHKVNIHSSFQQITWGNLQVKREMEPLLKVTDIGIDTANFKMQYVVSTGSKNEKRYFYVEEFYRVRYTEERMYLIDYERRMDEFFDASREVYNENRIYLGVVGEETEFRESEDGKILVFVVNNKLCEYNLTTNKIAVLFSFYDQENADVRTICNHHGIKILDVEETGNVAFAVYGYMNRGRHEGQNGIQVYTYNSAQNTIKEELYVAYEQSFEILKKEIDELLYLSREHLLYFKLDGILYKVSLYEKEYETIEQSQKDGKIFASKSNKMVAWQTSPNPYQSKEIKLLDLNRGTMTRIGTRSVEYIMPLGFMGDDFIYGKAYVNDVTKDATGQVIFPMYRVNIVDSNGDILKSYSQHDNYVTGCRIEENQIILSRVIKNEQGEFEDYSDEYITSNGIEKEGKNHFVQIVTEEYEKQFQFELNTKINEKSLKVLTPKEVLFEGTRTLKLEREKTRVCYYVYGLYGLEGMYENPAEAVQAAEAVSGTVLNDTGNYIWKKVKRVSRNQIMAIKEASITAEKDSVAVCLDTMLKYEGIIRNSEYLLAQGETIQSVLHQNLENAEVLDLRGCSLDSILYYVNKDIPVFAYVHDGSAVLVIGFNDYNIVLMDPKEGTIYKKGMKDSKEWFEENGNCFLTYIKSEL